MTQIYIRRFPLTRKVDSLLETLVSFILNITVYNLIVQIYNFRAYWAKILHVAGRTAWEDLFLFIEEKLVTCLFPFSVPCLVSSAMRSSYWHIKCSQWTLMQPSTYYKQPERRASSNVHDDYQMKKYRMSHVFALISTNSVIKPQTVSQSANINRIIYTDNCGRVYQLQCAV